MFGGVVRPSQNIPRLSLAGGLGLACYTSVPTGNPGSVIVNVCLRLPHLPAACWSAIATLDTKIFISNFEFGVYF